MILIPTDFEHDMTPLSVQLTSILALQFLPDILVQLRSLLFVGQSLYRLLILSGSTNLLLPPLLGVDINIPASHLNPLPTVRLLCWFNQIFLLLNNIYFCRLNRKQISKSIYIDQHFFSLAKFDRITILLLVEALRFFEKKDTPTPILVYQNSPYQTCRCWLNPQKVVAWTPRCSQSP